MFGVRDIFIGTNGLQIDRFEWRSPKDNVGMNFQFDTYLVVLLGGEIRLAKYDHQTKEFYTGLPLKLLPKEQILEYAETDYRASAVFPETRKEGE